MKLLKQPYSFAGEPWSAAYAVSTAIFAGDGLSCDERPLLANAPRAPLPAARPERQLLIDVSVIARHDDQTGVQRVIRSLLRELFKNPPNDCRVEPVYLINEGTGWHYRYARQWVARLFDDPLARRVDEPIRWREGDRVLIADLTGLYAVGAAHDGLYQKLKADGVETYLIVYDLLPMQMPENVPPVGFVFPDWLTALTEVVEGVVCISRAVSDDMRTWVSAAMPQRLPDLRIGWFHLGSDIEASTPTRGVPADFDQSLLRMKSAPTFLMVGTIEPRKGHLQTIDAFERLWRKGIDVNLVIVGRIGWRILRDEFRRNIPVIEHRLRTHPELGKRLIWFADASDELLSKVYAAGTCLIAASEGEGFGLPLIEAAKQGVPIIARDMPVFREVAGQHAHYFSGVGSRALAKAIEQWLALFHTGNAPASLHMPRLTWAESAKRLIDILDSWSPSGEAEAPDVSRDLQTDPMIQSEIDRFDLRHALVQASNNHVLKVSTPRPSSPDVFIADSTCAARDFFHDRFGEICRILGMEPTLHRKIWEFCYIYQRLEAQGLLVPGRRGLGFGVGAEPLPSAFARLGVKITATDAPPEIGYAEGWLATHQFGQSKEKLFHSKIVDRDSFDRNVSFSICDMKNIDENLKDFDFCWSACCFEHLGSLANGLEFVQNSVEKTLIIGGVACHTTEFNISSNDETVDRGPTVLYRKKDIEDFLELMRNRGHYVEQFRISDDINILDTYVDLPPYKQSPHLKLRMGQFTTTSAGIMIRRGV